MKLRYSWVTDLEPWLAAALAFSAMVLAPDQPVAG